MENEQLLYVPVCHQNKVVKDMGAKFKRKSLSNNTNGYFFVPNTIDEEKSKQLLANYGRESYEAKQKEKNLLLEWKKTILENDNFECLRMAKKYGFPKDEKVMESLFLKFNDRNKENYPISWEHLREYIPSFDEEFGVDRYLELHRKYNLQGDMVEAISKSNMSTIDKYFLYFVYEINE